MHARRPSRAEPLDGRRVGRVRPRRRRARARARMGRRGLGVREYREPGRARAVRVAVRREVLPGAWGWERGRMEGCGAAEAGAGRVRVSCWRHEVEREGVSGCADVHHSAERARCGGWSVRRWVFTCVVRSLFIDTSLDARLIGL